MDPVSQTSTTVLTPEQPQQQPSRLEIVAQTCRADNACLLKLLARFVAFTVSNHIPAWLSPEKNQC